jgi:hypothetical protein
MKREESTGAAIEAISRRFDHESKQEIGYEDE